MTITLSTILLFKHFLFSSFMPFFQHYYSYVFASDLLSDELQIRIAL